MKIRNKQKKFGKHWSNMHDLRFQAKKPYDFDRNKDRSTLSERVEQPNITVRNRENLNRSNTYGL